MPKRRKKSGPIFEAKSLARKLSFATPGRSQTVGGVLAAIAGAITGAPYGIVVVTYMGALPGALAGFLLKRFLPGARRSAYNVMPGIVWSCTSLGMALEAFDRNPQQAAHGFVYGGLVGLGGGLVVCILLPVAFYTVQWRSNRKRSGTSFSSPPSATGQSPR
jgi:hypothetical protein